VSRHGVLRGPAEIHVGAGALAALPGVTRRHGTRVLLCGDRVMLDQAAVGAVVARLRDDAEELVVFDAIEPDLPLSVLDAVLGAVDGRAIDVVVGLGGGSAIDTAKLAALLLRHPGPAERYYGENAIPGPVAPIVAVPTTAGTGSEVTPVAVVGDPGRRLKVGVSSLELIPSAAICDFELTLSCPASVTAFSGIDALAHAVEAYTSRARPRDWASYPGEIFQGRTALTDGYALTAIEAIAGSLERAVADGHDRPARQSMLYGSLCAGLAFGNAGTAGAHALQYPVGAATGTPHGLGVGLLLPSVLRYTAPACGPALTEVAGALGVEPAPEAAIAEIARLAAAVGVPRTLAEIGIDPGDLPEFAELAAGITRLAGNSPRELDATAMLTILEDAFAGA
jgi:alcohol dehydrogenase